MKFYRNGVVAVTVQGSQMNQKIKHKQHPDLETKKTTRKLIKENFGR